jgi:hypothetical protein
MKGRLLRDDVTVPYAGHQFRSGIFYRVSSNVFAIVTILIRYPDGRQSTLRINRRSTVNRTCFGNRSTTSPVKCWWWCCSISGCGRTGGTNVSSSRQTLDCARPRGTSTYRQSHRYTLPSHQRLRLSAAISFGLPASLFSFVAVSGSARVTANSRSNEPYIHWTSSSSSNSSWSGTSCTSGRPIGSREIRQSPFIGAICDDGERTGENRRHTGAVSPLYRNGLPFMACSKLKQVIDAVWREDQSVRANIGPSIIIFVCVMLRSQTSLWSTKKFTVYNGGQWLVVGREKKLNLQRKTRH